MGFLTICVRFDVETRHAFVGDLSGQVTIQKLEQDNCSLVTTFKGHTGASANSTLQIDTLFTSQGLQVNKLNT